MIYLNVLALTLLFSFNTMARGLGLESLSEVERSSCLMFPQVTPLSEATAGLQYKVEQDFNCNPDCRDSVTVKLDYRYNQITVLDYYNVSGKLVTSKTDKRTEKMNAQVTKLSEGVWKHDSYEIGEIPADTEAEDQLARLHQMATNQIELEIRRKIYDGAEVCTGSFYK